MNSIEIKHYKKGFTAGFPNQKSADFAIKLQRINIKQLTAFSKEEKEEAFKTLNDMAMVFSKFHTVIHSALINNV